MDHESKSRAGSPVIAVFGHFGTLNFGNEITFQTMLYHIRRLLPEAQMVGICSFPDVVAKEHQIKAIQIRRDIFRASRSSNSITRILRRLCIGMPCELYRWLEAFKALAGADLFIIPGTGLVT